MNTSMSGKTAITGAASLPSGIALAPVIVWLASMSGVEIPAEVAAALGGIIAAIAAFLVAWLVPAKQGTFVDINAPDDADLIINRDDVDVDEFEEEEAV